jgi:chromosome partitioning protein
MKKPTIISISTIRGGEGKTLFTILLSRYLPGKKLLIDGDIQNALSFWSMSSRKRQLDKANNASKNLFNAIINRDTENNTQFINNNLDIIISDIKLLDIQNLEMNRLLFFKEITGYDYILIDCAPTVSGLIYNFWQIADLIILPCGLNFFSFKSIAYTLKKIETVNPVAKIKVFVNQYEKSKSNHSYLNQLLQTLQSNPEISKYLSEIKIPKSIFFKQLNDNMLDKIPDQAKTKKLLLIIDQFIQEVRK